MTQAGNTGKILIRVKLLNCSCSGLYKWFHVEAVSVIMWFLLGGASS